MQRAWVQSLVGKLRSHMLQHCQREKKIIPSYRGCYSIFALTGDSLRQSVKDASLTSYKIRQTQLLYIHPNFCLSPPHSFFGNTFVIWFCLHMQFKQALVTLKYLAYRPVGSKKRCCHLPHVTRPADRASSNCFPN